MILETRSTLSEVMPSLKTVLADAAPLPREAVFLGLAQDGLPVLLNLFDPVSGPILVCGDPGSGKTRLLKMIARAIEQVHPASEVQFCVITPHPAEWDDLRDSQNNAGIFDSQDAAAQDLVRSLAEWSRSNEEGHSSVLLLVDDLQALTCPDEAAQQQLRWLLLRGPRFRAWTIATANPEQVRALGSWTGCFRTRLLGFTTDAADADLLAHGTGKALDQLLAGHEFCMREGDTWLNFWAPSSEE